MLVQRLRRWTNIEPALCVSPFCGLSIILVRILNVTPLLLKIMMSLLHLCSLAAQIGRTRKSEVLKQLQLGKDMWVQTENRCYNATSYWVCSVFDFQLLLCAHIVKTWFSERLGMSGGKSPRHAQNPLTAEYRKILTLPRRITPSY